MIRNEVKLIGRLTADPELKYTKNSNTPVCNVVLAVNNIYNDDAEYLHLVFWDKKATNLCKYKGKGDLLAVTGYLKIDEVDYLGFTKKGIDKSENIPDLDPNHKSQEEYQMIHNALSESEDLPF